jgi:hypothetical protein
MHRRAGGDRSLASTIEAFVQAWPALQRGKAAFAASRTDKTIRLAPPEHKGSAARFVRLIFYSPNLQVIDQAT